MTNSDLPPSIIDTYASNLSEIKRLQKENDLIKQQILTTHNPGDIAEGTRFLVRIKADTQRYKDYLHKDTILSFIVDNNIIDDCIKFNKSSINQYIKDGILPETIQNYEIKEESAPTILVEELNTWESLS